MATVSPEEIPAHSDEDLTDLLSEIRLLLPGTQILVAFLVILPFNSGYTRVSRLDNVVYVITFICAMVSLLMFIAPRGPAPTHAPPARPGGLQAVGKPPGDHGLGAAVDFNHFRNVFRHFGRGERPRRRNCNRPCGPGHLLALVGHSTGQTRAKGAAETRCGVILAALDPGPGAHRRAPLS